MLNLSRNEARIGRVLYQQFLFRIVELETLSSKADTIKLLGQFASVLVMFSLILMLTAFGFMDATLPAGAQRAANWSMEYRLLSLTFLVVGLFSTLSWESLLPDQRDAFVLGPLPVRPITLCLAKVIASASAVGLSALALNCASGLIWPAALAQPGFISLVRSYIAYWLTLLFAVLFLFSAILALQSAAALVLSRPAFLRISTLLQAILFAGLLVTFFFEPVVLIPDRLALQARAVDASWFPPYCFAAMFFQMQGSLPSAIRLVAIHGWVLSGASTLGATLCSAVLYAKLLGRIVSTPDIVRRSPSLGRSTGTGRSLQNALLLFAGRAFIRNKQQKLIAAFYLGLGSAILFGVLGLPNSEPEALARLPSRISLRFLVSTIMAMTAVVIGFRASFAFPASLKANWVFRLHQVQAASAYLGATRRTLFLVTVIPVCAVSIICGLIWEPVRASTEHVVLLGLYGVLLADLSLYGNRKIPYTCSYLPGNAQLPFLFWGGVFLFIPATAAWARTEQKLLYSSPAYGAAFVSLILCVCVLEWRNRSLSADAELCFDEIPEDIIVGLDLNRR